MTGEGDRQSLNRLINQVASELHSPVMDPHYSQYLHTASSTAAPIDHSLIRNNFGTSNGDTANEYLAILLAQNRQKLGNLNAANSRFFESPSYDLGNMYLGNYLPSPSKNSRNFQNMRMSQSASASMMKAPFGGLQGSSHVDIGSTAEVSLLEGFKNNKTRSLELSEIVGHVIEFRYLPFCIQYTSFKVASSFFLIFDFTPLAAWISMEAVSFSRNLRLQRMRKRMQYSLRYFLMVAL